MRRLLLGLIMAVVLVLGACTENDISVKEDETGYSWSATIEEVQDESAEESESEEENEEDSESDSSPVGTITNPVPLGETAVIQTGVYDDNSNLIDAEFEITISNVERGELVMEFLLEQNMFNEEPPEGYEWMMFDVEFSAKIDDPSVAALVAPTFNVFNEDGSPMNQHDLYATFDGIEFGWVDVYDGESTSGKAAVIVPIDKSVVIEYSDFNVEFFLRWSEGKSNFRR